MDTNTVSVEKLTYDNMLSHAHLQQEMLTLLEARTLLSCPDSWCQHTSAQDAAGEPVVGDSPEAVRWCLAGALRRCSPSWPPPYARLGQALRARNDTRSLVNFNDQVQHHQVINLLDQAVRLTLADLAGRAPGHAVEFQTGEGGPWRPADCLGRLTGPDDAAECLLLRDPFGREFTAYIYNLRIRGRSE